MSEWVSTINDWVYAIVSALVAAIIALVRKVNTNERQIELLNKEIVMREEARKAVDDSVKEQLSELRQDVKSLIMNFGNK